MMKRPNKGYIGKSAALTKLQRYCAYQDRCHKEVRTKLYSLGMYGDELEEIIVLLIEDDFLNEERFARSYARGKFRHKQWGRIRIKRELKFRQISDYCIKKAMQEIAETDYEETLMTILRKKKALLPPTSSYQNHKKLFDFAFYRGFEVELIRKCIKLLTDIN